jgi:cytochrome c553
MGMGGGGDGDGAGIFPPIHREVRRASAAAASGAAAAATRAACARCHVLDSVAIPRIEMVAATS